ncbi:MAG: S8 family serine peptidase, partial [Clostridium sp.]
GTEYNKDTITEAIKTKVQGGVPYEIVDHKDEVGHGTALAGIIGGRNLGEGDTLKSIAPKCEFAIMKIKDIKKTTLESIGIERDAKNVYQVSTIALAINYLSNLQAKLKKPMVVYLPLGSNFGGRDGGTILERFIENLTDRRDFSVVTNTGNQGRGETHTSGVIEDTGETKDILINVGKSQNFLSMIIYIRRPDTIYFSITSPGGDSITKIPVPTIKEQNKYLTFKKNNIDIQYFAQERINGSVNLNILIKSVFEGVWKISLFGESIINGLYDSWLLQSELLKEDTRFLNPDPNTTLVTPCSSINIISTSCYNQ